MVTTDVASVLKRRTFSFSWSNFFVCFINSGILIIWRSIYFTSKATSNMLHISYMIPYQHTTLNASGYCCKANDISISTEMNAFLGSMFLLKIFWGLRSCLDWPETKHIHLLTLKGKQELKRLLGERCLMLLQQICSHFSNKFLFQELGKTFNQRSPYY